MPKGRGDVSYVKEYYLVFSAWVWLKSAVQAESCDENLFVDRSVTD